jgi:hypothetical protein
MSKKSIIVLKFKFHIFSFPEKELLFVNVIVL